MKYRCTFPALYDNNDLSNRQGHYVLDATSPEEAAKKASPGDYVKERLVDVQSWPDGNYLGLYLVYTGFLDEVFVRLIPTRSVDEKLQIVDIVTPAGYEGPNSYSDHKS